MAMELETGLPSTRLIQTLIREEKEVELKLTTGDLVAGKIRWQDANCVSLVDHYDQQTIVWRQAIVYLKPRQ
ncbi:RNA-binding protein hfq [Leptolyngbya sp. FACHB-36]|uniref:Hfq-related RNA-binding protein n=1 Tax=Leptolyngbya sp. FACHB-36 TaxID=2692808 RepID=UPI0016800E41|nr:RNA-binding protein hfq [Leptolyngbya sp. FACHB-36]MBD2020138.1 RNA-binding protein hfq [Leptolyngbya sp. FACHB-36]